MKDRAKDSSNAESSSSLELSNTLEKKVAEWLTGQGYPLEMYTVKCCRDRGLTAYQSWYYLDREKQQQRETDVYAHTRRVRVNKTNDFQLSFTFECKQSRARPWVAFVHDNDSNSMSPTAAMAQRFVPEYAVHWWRNLAHKARKNKEYPFQNANKIAHSIVRVSFDRSNEDAAYAALMSVAKAADGVTYWLEQTSSEEDIDPLYLYYAVVIPVLVLDAPLFGCHLDTKGELSVVPINSCTLQWGNQISGNRPPTTIVEIVTKSALPEFLSNMDNALAQISNLASKPRPS